jgi:3-oxoacyl-[acyl-carrier protein] reductase
MDPKTYFVVGGSRGIGREIARQLNGRGHRVFVGSRSADNLDEIDGVAHIPMDVTTDTLQADALPARLDGLVYCPGSIRLRPFRSLKPEDFLTDYQINVLGAVRTLQICLPALKKAGAASIVLFSTVAVQTGMPFHASIASAKGAIEGLTRALAAELAPGIRVNALAPSLTDTPLAAGLLGSDEKRRAADERHPLRRIGQPGDIAAAALYLLGEAGAWVTGQILHVDGGMGSLRTFK